MKYRAMIQKGALLSCCFVTASVNAITGNIPKMAQTFNTVDLHIVELITTIPALFSMLGIFFVQFMSKYKGLKGMMLIALALCGISGIVPFFIQNIQIILMARAVFGFGTGMIMTALLSLIIQLFEGNDRSTMIGLQGSAGGLGSLVTTFIAGSLLQFGWHASFLTYTVAFGVLIIAGIFVPRVESGMKMDTSDKKETRFMAHDRLRFLGYITLFFISTAYANLYIIKSSTLITQAGIGASRDGSTLIMLISLGSILSGAVYGRIVVAMRWLTLPVSYSAIGLACIIAGRAQNFGSVLLSAFIFGFGFMIFVPYIQDCVNKELGHYGNKVITLLLIIQGLAGFSAPFLGRLLDNLGHDVHGVYYVGALVYGVLALYSAWFTQRRHNLKKEETVNHVY